MVKYAQQVLLRQDAPGVGLEELALLKALDIVPAEHVSVLALCLIVCFAARRSGVCVVVQMLFLVWLKIRQRGTGAATYVAPAAPSGPHRRQHPPQ